MNTSLKRIRAPRAAIFPVIIEGVLVEAGQTVEKGTALYILRDAKGRRMKIPSPESGRIEEGPIPVGASVGENMPIIGIRLNSTNHEFSKNSQTPPSQAEKATVETRRTPKNAQGGPSPEKEAAGAIRSETIIEDAAHGLEFKSVLPVLKFAMMIVGMTLGLNILAHAFVPYFEYSAAQLQTLIAIAASAGIAVMAARRWPTPPTHGGYLVGVIGAAVVSFVASTEAHSALNHRSHDEPRYQSAATDSSNQARSISSEDTGEKTDVWEQKLADLTSAPSSTRPAPNKITLPSTNTTRSPLPDTRSQTIPGPSQAETILAIKDIYLEARNPNAFGENRIDAIDIIGSTIKFTHEMGFTKEINLENGVTIELENNRSGDTSGRPYCFDKNVMGWLHIRCNQGKCIKFTDPTGSDGVIDIQNSATSTDQFCPKPNDSALRLQLAKAYQHLFELNGAAVTLLDPDEARKAFE